MQEEMEGAVGCSRFFASPSQNDRNRGAPSLELYTGKKHASSSATKNLPYRMSGACFGCRCSSRSATRRLSPIGDA